jgi:hypothetical protein
METQNIENSSNEKQSSNEFENEFQTFWSSRMNMNIDCDRNRKKTVRRYAYNQYISSIFEDIRIPASYNYLSKWRLQRLVNILETIRE